MLTELVPAETAFGNDTISACGVIFRQPTAVVFTPGETRRTGTHGRHPLFEPLTRRSECFERIADGIVVLRQYSSLLPKSEGSLVEGFRPTLGNEADLRQGIWDALLADLVRCTMASAPTAVTEAGSPPSFQAYMARIERLAADFDRTAVRVSPEQAAALRDDAFVEAMQLKDSLP